MSSLRRSPGVVLVSAAFLLWPFASGCAGPRVLGAPAIPRDSLAQPPSAPLDPQKCQEAALSDSPLVTEWPATDKANLEILSKRGAVAVAFSGCSMRVLSSCAFGGQYFWHRITPVSDAFEIADEASLYARLPLAAASLEGELTRWGKLNVQTFVSGQLRLQGVGAAEVPATAECAGATHVVTAMSIGAFAMTRGGGDRVGAGLDVTVAGGGAKASHSATVLRAAGNGDTCAQGTDQAPHPNCASPIQVFLQPVPDRRGLSVAPAGGANAGPTQLQPVPASGTVQPPQPGQQPAEAAGGAVGQGAHASWSPIRGGVLVDIVSAQADSRWDIYVDDEVICSTPCTRMLDPNRPIMLRARGDGLTGRPDTLQVRNLFPSAERSNELQLLALPTHQGEFVTGLTFTSLGGMSVFMGAFLAGIGCSDMVDRPGLCTAGLITAGVGAAVGLGAVWLIVDALPKAVVAPLKRAATRP